MFHTDGSVIKIIPSLIDAGVQILEAVQTDCIGMDPQTLKSEFGSRLAFHGAISVQSLLPRGSVQEVSETCAMLVRVLGKGGGYVAAPSHAIQVGTPPCNVEAMLRTVIGADDYVAAIAAAKQ
jgi:uroporphyrinogen decarboxylase